MEKCFKKKQNKLLNEDNEVQQQEQTQDRNDNKDNNSLLSIDTSTFNDYN